ncbi:hypothetical protein HPMG_01345 [Helicobacter pullorum MIT 98-5489]|uniref:Uncharacterized protein n=1 Tax=Helicobacter pullorum MIT 98-5489 TaxID=537972 RepID=C5F0Y4_9HELI|nr:hypothetical protein HPMG_01345 [Helicobacter pullorum MIT 98-5489]
MTISQPKTQPQTQIKNSRIQNQLINFANHHFLTLF